MSIPLKSNTRKDWAFCSRSKNVRKADLLTGVQPEGSIQLNFKALWAIFPVRYECRMTENPDKRPMNLKELSQQLGLSQTTVSRALNGYPEVSESTRERVAAAARKFNYRPNTRAKGLATGQSMMIGHVLPMSGNLEMVNPIFGDFIAGAGEAYARSGYEMLLSVVNEDDDESVGENAVYRTFCANGTVDGIMIHGPRRSDPRLPLLEELGLPFVVHGRATGHPNPYPFVDVNNRRAFQRATSFLLDLGHRRIALINGPEEMDFAHRRRRGYEDALAERGLTPDPALMTSDEMSEHYAFCETNRMLDAETSPTAFVVASFICALGTRRAIESRGLTLGRDVSVVTHDDALSYLRNGGAEPIFTAVRSSVRDAGRRCGQMLIDRIANPHGPVIQEMLEAELTVGLSTGPAPQT